VGDECDLDILARFTGEDSLFEGVAYSKSDCEERRKDEPLFPKLKRI